MSENQELRMKVSFDLDEVLFVNPANHKIEDPPKFPFDRLYKERVRLGTKELIPKLRELGFDVWVYTSSFRSVNYIKYLFRHYGVTFDGIINGQRHQKEVQGDRPYPMPTKLPNFYQISLHIDDEEIVATYGKSYGFDVYQLDAQDDDWAEKIIDRAIKIRDTKFKKIMAPVKKI